MDKMHIHNEIDTIVKPSAGEKGRARRHFPMVYICVVVDTCRISQLYLIPLFAVLALSDGSSNGILYIRSGLKLIIVKTCRSLRST